MLSKVRWLCVSLSCTLWLQAGASARCAFRQVDAASLSRGFEESEQHPLLILLGLAEVDRSNVSAAFLNSTLYITPGIEHQAQHGFTTDIEIGFDEYVRQLHNHTVPYAFRQCHLSPSCDKALVKAYRIPGFLQNTARDLFVAIGKGSGGFPLHVHDRTWALSLAGQKQWFVSAPGRPPVQPFLNHTAATLSQLTRCTQRPGQIVYLPKGWWHATLVESDWSVSIGGQGGSKGMIYSACRGNAKTISQTSMSSLLKLDEQGINVAGHASRAGHVSVLAALLTKRADLSATDGNGWSVAQHAAKLGHASVIRWLASKNIRLDTTNNVARSAVHTAAKAGHAEVVTVLAQARAALEARDGEGLSPTQIAAAHGHSNVLSVLSSHEVGEALQLTRRHKPKRLFLTFGSLVVVIAACLYCLWVREKWQPACNCRVVESVLRTHIHRSTQ